MGQDKRQKVGSFSERFLSALEYLQESEGAPVSDFELRNHLGWSNKSYSNTKSQLKLEGSILIEDGQGRKPITLAKPKSKKSKVFISYCHADKSIHNKLLTHLKPLCHLNLIEIWHDQMIKAGEDWETEIWSKFDASDVILLLISADFISSEFCYQKELKRALERHKNKEALLIPIIVRSCYWHDLAFGKIQALPTKGLAVESHPNLDDALTDVVVGLKKTLADRSH